MAKINEKTLKAFEKFNADLEIFREETESTVATLYEDAFTTRNVIDFKITKTGVLTWEEDGRKEREVMYDDYDAREWLAFWKACLRKARKYWSMDAERLDAITDGTAEDINDEEN